MSESGEGLPQQPISGEFKTPDKPLHGRTKGMAVIQNLVRYGEYYDSKLDGNNQPLKLHFDIERHVPKNKERAGFRYSAIINLYNSPSSESRKVKTLTQAEFAEKMREMEGFEEVEGHNGTHFTNSTNGILVNWFPPHDGGDILLGVIHTTPLTALSEVTGTIAPELVRIFNQLSPEVKITDEVLKQAVALANSVGNNEALLPVGSR